MLKITQFDRKKIGDSQATISWNSGISQHDAQCFPKISEETGKLVDKCEAWNTKSTADEPNLKVASLRSREKIQQGPDRPWEIL